MNEYRSLLLLVYSLALRCLRRAAARPSTSNSQRLLRCRIADAISHRRSPVSKKICNTSATADTRTSGSSHAKTASLSIETTVLFSEPTLHRLSIG